MPTLTVLQFRAMPMSREADQMMWVVMPIVLAAAVLLSPFQMFFVLSIQAVNPFSGDTWWPANARSSLLDLRNPLPYAAYSVRWSCILSLNWLVGSFASFFWFPVLTSLALVGLGLSGLGVAAGWGLGLRWAVRSFKHKHPRLPAIDEAG
ncbi:MAG: hypothetical protein AAF586_08740 [Planctomycetota bacterium]